MVDEDTFRQLQLERPRTEEQMDHRRKPQGAPNFEASVRVAGQTKSTDLANKQVRKHDCAGGETLLSIAQAYGIDANLVGRDVAVYDAEQLAGVVAKLVGVAQTGGGLSNDGGGDRERDPLATIGGLPDDLHQVSALDVLHHQAVLAIDLTQLLHLHEVRVVESRGEPRLVQEHAVYPILITP